MKFIFPQNYSFKNKLFGVIDYTTLILNIIWNLFVFCSMNLLISNITIKIFIFVILCLPILLFSIIGFQHENIIQILIYLAKYINSNKLYLYHKNNHSHVRKYSLFLSSGLL